MAYERIRTADLIASSQKDVIDKRVVHRLNFDRTTKAREDTIRGLESKLNVRLNRRECETVDVYRL